MLILLYYLSQNPNFPESVKPLMGKLKNSQEMLKFLNDLSRFSEMFSIFQKQAKEQETTPPPPKGGPGPKEPGGKEAREQTAKESCPGEGKGAPPAGEEKPRSPTNGIADKFIEDCLERYFKKH